MTSPIRYRAELLDDSFIWVDKDARKGDCEWSRKSHAWIAIRKIYPIQPVTNPLLQVEELPLFDEVDLQSQTDQQRKVSS